MRLMRTRFGSSDADAAGRGDCGRERFKCVANAGDVNADRESVGNARERRAWAEPSLRCVACERCGPRECIVLVRAKATVRGRRRWTRCTCHLDRQRAEQAAPNRVGHMTTTKVTDRRTRGPGIYEAACTGRLPSGVFACPLIRQFSLLEHLDVV